jgi:phage-related protein
MDRFMDSHPEIAEQLRKNPELFDNKQFVDGHPALRDFLAEHPGIQQEVRDNPNYFMRDEERYARRQDQWGHDNDGGRANLASFHEFLEGHNDVANELAKNPTLATNQEYLENHGELRAYLNANPQVNRQLNQNPQGFVGSAESFDANSNAMTKGTMRLPATDPKK